MSAAVAVPIQQPKPAPVRQDTPERWQRASERAKLASVELTYYELSDTWFVSSATYPGVHYESDGTHCTCEAYANGDPVCLHRAAVRDHLAERAALGIELLQRQEELRQNWEVLDRYNAALGRDGDLSPRGWDALDRAGERDWELHRRIREIKDQLDPHQKTEVAA